MKIKDLIPIIKHSSVRIYRHKNSAYEAFENGRIMHGEEIPKKLHNLEITELASGCNYEIDEHYIIIRAKG